MIVVMMGMDQEPILYDSSAFSEGLIEKQDCVSLTERARECQLIMLKR